MPNNDDDIRPGEYENPGQMPYCAAQNERPTPDKLEVLEVLAPELATWIRKHMSLNVVGTNLEQWAHIMAGNTLEAYQAIMEIANKGPSGSGTLTARSRKALRKEAQSDMGQVFWNCFAICSRLNFDIAETIRQGADVFATAREERYGEVDVFEALRNRLLEDQKKGLTNTGSYQIKLQAQEDTRCRTPEKSSCPSKDPR